MCADERISAECTSQAPKMYKPVHRVRVIRAVACVHATGFAARNASTMTETGEAQSLHTNASPRAFATRNPAPKEMTWASKKETFRR